MKEEWKIIPNFSNYEASSLGRIRNKNGQILKLRLNGTRENNLYLAVKLMMDGKTWRDKINSKVMRVHRLVLMAFQGLPLKGQIACHKNDIKTENSSDNLYWGTHKSNAKDSIISGTFKFAHPGFGEDHHNFKYSDNLINKIRSEYTGKRGEQSALARKYGIPQQYLSSILNNKMRKAA